MIAVGMEDRHWYPNIPPRILASINKELNERSACSVSILHNPTSLGEINRKSGGEEEEEGEAQMQTQKRKKYQNSELCTIAFTT